MKKFIVITLLLIMLVITQENACTEYTTQEECEGDIINICHYDSDGATGCHQIENKDDYCEYKSENHQCSIKSGATEDVTKLCKLGSLSEDSVPCESVDAQCHDYDSDQDKCKQLQNCGFDNDICFSVTLDSDCQFSSNQNQCSIDSNTEICELISAEGNDKRCAKRVIQCSDFNGDSTKCKNADLQATTKKCGYNSSITSGDKCFEVSIENGCTYNNENNQCTGEYLSEGKICALDTTSSVACKKRNIECNEFDENEDKCESAKLLHKNKECFYNEQNQCVEKECEFTSSPTKQCVSLSPSKIKCTLNAN